jgi:hypothetical protein
MDYRPQSHTPAISRIRKNALKINAVCARRILLHNYPSWHPSPRSITDRHSSVVIERDSRLDSWPHRDAHHQPHLGRKRYDHNTGSTQPVRVLAKTPSPPASDQHRHRYRSTRFLFVMLRTQVRSLWRPSARMIYSHDMLIVPRHSECASRHGGPIAAGILRVAACRRSAFVN